MKFSQKIRINDKRIQIIEEKRDQADYLRNKYFMIPKSFNQINFHIFYRIITFVKFSIFKKHYHKAQ